jgi:hypothetical protein
VGYVIQPTKIEEIPNLITSLNKNKKNSEKIRDIRSKTVYNIGKSATVGAEYIRQLNKELSSNN